MTDSAVTLSRTAASFFDWPTERVVALARIFLAAFAGIAIYVDPPDDANVLMLATLIGVYLVFALGVFAVVLLHRVRPWQALVEHAADIGATSLLMYFSESQTSPFFVFFIFVLLCATLRWNWRGAVLTTAVLLAVFAVLVATRIAALRSEIGANSDFDLDRAVMRDAFLLVGGAMLAYIGAVRERGSERLRQLASWPGPIASTFSDARLPLDAGLAHASTVMRAPRIVVLFENPEEPDANIVIWNTGRLTHERIPEDALKTSVAPELFDLTFMSNDVGSRIYLTAAGLRTSRQDLITPPLRASFGTRSVASAPFSRTLCSGRVFLLDRDEDWQDEHLLLMQIVASRIGVEIEHHVLRLKLEEIAAARERMRVARDLHDGVLQTLTAAGLQLKGTATQSGGPAHETIDSVRHLLADEQTRLRLLIDEAQPSRDRRRRDYLLYSETEKDLDKLRRLWGCEIDLSVEPKDAVVSRGLAHEINFILAEGVANAVKHGGASLIGIAMVKTTMGLELQLRDNGRGLTAHEGTYDHVQLATLDIGPLSVRRRVAELSGSLSLSTSANGVDLNVWIPL